MSRRDHRLVPCPLDNSAGAVIRLEWISLLCRDITIGSLCVGETEIQIETFLKTKQTREPN